MDVVVICMLIGVLLPYIWAGASAPFRNKQFGTVDLKQPRVQGDQLVDRGAWAWGAQMNAWEALVVFGVANAAAIATNVDPSGSWQTAAVIWVVARVLHGVFYIAGIPPLRVLSFVTGLAMSLWILAMAM